MGVHTEYYCNECGFVLEDSSNIFWIDEDKNVHVDVLVVSTSNEAEKALVSGGIYKYYCYNCNKVVYEFHINKKSDSISDDEVIEIIETFDDIPKVINYDYQFQNCISCGRKLPIKLEKVFAMDHEGKFYIKNYLDDFNNRQFDFYGKYYGYFCRDCSKQINKFVILENTMDLKDSLIQEILEDHTNDLTIYINDSYEICPRCGDEVHPLGESTICPKCRLGVLNVFNQTIID